MVDHPHSAKARLRRVLSDPRRLRALPAMLAYRLRLFTTDRLTDWKMGVETCAIFNQPDATLAAHSIPSQPVPLREIELAMQELPRPLPAHFVDVGCGIGRACFYASYFLGFSKVTGVDFDPALVARAQENAKGFRNRNNTDFEFLVGDARVFTLPREKCVVFLCNPFDATILAQFLRNNIGHFRQHGSVVAYTNDIHRGVLQDLQFTQVGRPHKSVSNWVLKG